MHFCELDAEYSDPVFPDNGDCAVFEDFFSEIERNMTLIVFNFFATMAAV